LGGRRPWRVSATSLGSKMESGEVGSIMIVGVPRLAPRSLCRRKLKKIGGTHDSYPGRGGNKGELFTNPRRDPCGISYKGELIGYTGQSVNGGELGGNSKKNAAAVGFKRGGSLRVRGGGEDQEGGRGLERFCTGKHRDVEETVCAFAPRSY